MEKFFDEVREKYPVQEWFCGHHHLDMWSLDKKLRFMYHDVIMLGDTEDRKEETNESESH